MLLTIDAGNTNIVFALFDADRLVCKWRIKTMAGRTADEYQSFCLPLLNAENLTWAHVDAALLSSVVPAENFNLNQFCERHVGRKAVSLKDAKLDTGLTIHLPQPETLGADRVANAVAAKTKYPMPCVVVDFGTSTTFEVLDEAGAYCGGIITAGPNLSLEALHRVSAKLPNIDIAKPESVCATDTVSAMQSGIYHGYLSMIDGLVEKLAAEKGAFKTVVATGGLAPLYATDSKTITVVDGDLTLHGLRILYDRNKALFL